MKRQLLLAATVLLTGLIPITSNADCQCMCVNGTVQAMCSRTTDVQPICAPRVCPLTPPSVTPITSPHVPPVGTTQCAPRQVYNEYTHQYEWKEVCS